ncbi:hypothetical protein ACEWY4_022714 [Coilia grayii]|uniref:EGF-like domain-containing protein n=1 Tax=Coilia grayii TaxID=363190 RepID=A0ABD1J0Y0_9TELE
MAALRTSLCVLCLLLHLGLLQAHTSDHKAKEEAMAVLIDKMTSSYTAANLSLTNLVNTAKTLTHPHNQNCLRKGLEVFDSVANIVTFIDYFGSLVRCAHAFMFKSSPEMMYLKRHFTQVNKLLASISAEAGPLPSTKLWPSTQAELILNAWSRLEQLVGDLAVAESQEEKSRAAARFTAYCESRGVEDAVVGFYRRVAQGGAEAGGEGGGIMQLMGDQSEGDVRLLTWLSSHVTSVLIRGSFVSAVYDKLKSSHARPEPQPATDCLLALSKLIQKTMMDYADGYEKWVRKDVEKIVAHASSTETRISMATDIKAHLDGKFSWFTWSVIVQDSSTEHGFLYGDFITIHVREQTVLLIPRDSEAVVDEGVRAQARKKMQGHKACPVVQEDMTNVFPASVMKHIAFAQSAPDSYSYTTVGDVVVEKCYTSFLFIKTNTYINTVVLKSMESLDNPSCSKLQCQHGSCRQVEQSSSGFCLCETMFYGHRCENSIKDESKDPALVEKINSVDENPVPDISTVYFQLQEQIRHADARGRFQQAKLHHQDLMDKLSFLSYQSMLFDSAQISVDEFLSNVEGVILSKGTCVYLLHQCDGVVMGDGLQADSSLLETLRNLLLHPEPPSLQTRGSIACSETYAEHIDRFVTFFTNLRAGALSACQKYFMYSDNPKPFPPRSAAQGLPQGTGCGPLSANSLLNHHCRTSYHSADQQSIRLRCSGTLKPFPEMVRCSKGRWNALPVCYAEPRNGVTRCRSDNRTTVCEVSCDDGSVFVPEAPTYRCGSPPCEAFVPVGRCKVTRCVSNSSCEDSEVCDGDGRCRDGCSGAPCGPNAACATLNHVPVCTCVGPWVKNPRQECSSPSLHWAHLLHIPNGTVKTPAGWLVCRGQVPNGDWHSGWLYTVAGKESCLLEYDGKTMRAALYELLLDPCAGSGYVWIPGGPHSHSMWTSYTNSTPGSMLFVCSWGGDGLDGKQGFSGTLVQTASGYRCIIALNRAAHSTPDYLTLVRVQAC